MTQLNSIIKRTKGFWNQLDLITYAYKLLIQTICLFLKSKKLGIN